jgi:hypothetical protein
MTEGGWDVFVSYGHEDAAWVRVLAANLHQADFDVFLDKWELVGGDRVAGRLEEGIRGSASGILMVSPHALSRPWVREEYEALLHQVVEQPGAAADPGPVRRRGAAAVPGQPAVGGLPRGGDHGPGVRGQDG